MVGLEVEEHCNSRAQPMDVLELEARPLAHDPRVASERPVEARQRTTDVAGDRHGPLGRAKDRTEQLARRGLPVRPGDADERVAEKAEAELDLAPDRDPARTRGRGQR